MLRRVLFNKSTVRSFASMQKYNQNTNEILYLNACFGGGVSGCILFSFLTYKDKFYDNHNHNYNNNNNFISCVAETTVMGMAGFYAGFTFIFLSPIIVPFGMVVGIIRYLDITLTENKNSKK